MLPLLFGGSLAYHVVMHGHWASGSSGLLGPIPYYVLLIIGILLTAMSVLSHFGPSAPRWPWNRRGR